MTARIDVNDPRLTAYALGELGAEEANEITAAAAMDPALQAEIGAIRAFGATLEAELVDEPVADLGAAARAAIVAAGDGSPAANDDGGAIPLFGWARRGSRRWLVAAALLVAAGGTAAIALSTGGGDDGGARGGDEPVLSERITEPVSAPAGELPAEVAATVGESKTEAGDSAGKKTNGQAKDEAATAALDNEREAQDDHRSPRPDKPAQPETTADGSEPAGQRAEDANRPTEVAGKGAEYRPLTDPTPRPGGLAGVLKRSSGGDAAPSADAPWASAGTGHAGLDNGGPARARRAASAGPKTELSAGIIGRGDLADAEDVGGIRALGGAIAGGSATADLDGDGIYAPPPADHFAGEGKAAGRGYAQPMLRGAGGVVIDTLSSPQGTYYTVQLPDGRIVQQYVAPTVPYDPAPYTYDRYTRRWYYDYDYYYYGQAPQGGAGEGYAPIYESPFKRVSESPLSTFSTDVDTASYTNVRRFLDRNQRPPRDAVRIEELVNAFTYDAPGPEDGQPLAVRTEVAACPWAPTHRLVRVAVAAREIDRAQRPGGNLVFLVDTSGSMSASNKLPLLKQGLRALVAELDARDTVTIVTYAGRAGIALQPTNGSNQATILRAISRLSAGGMTNGSAGLQLAYRLAREHYVAGGTNRVLLATDGDFNAGMTNQSGLIAQVTAAAADNIYLTVLGLGTGDLKDDRLEAISNRGNGTYAYLDSYREARRVLVDQLTTTLVTVAKDVKLQVEWNPANVVAYRLIGYENRAMANRDFEDDRKDAGDLGAGAQVTALYEVVPTGEPRYLRKVAPSLKYQPQDEADAPELPFTGPPAPVDVTAELMTVKVRYKAPQGNESATIEQPLVDEGLGFEEASEDFRWAASVAGFGMMLRRSYYRGNAFWGQIHALAMGAVGADPNGERTEMLRLLGRAERLYGWR